MYFLMYFSVFPLHLLPFFHHTQQNLVVQEVLHPLVNPTKFKFTLKTYNFIYDYYKNVKFSKCKS